MAALIALDSKAAGLETILGTQWRKATVALDTVFKTDSAAAVAPTPRCG